MHSPIQTQIQKQLHSEYNDIMMSIEAQKNQQAMP